MSKNEDRQDPRVSEVIEVVRSLRMGVKETYEVGGKSFNQPLDAVTHARYAAMVAVAKNDPAVKEESIVSLEPVLDYIAKWPLRVKMLCDIADTVERNARQIFQPGA